MVIDPWPDGKSRGLWLGMVILHEIHLQGMAPLQKVSFLTENKY